VELAVSNNPVEDGDLAAVSLFDANKGPHDSLLEIHTIPNRLLQVGVL